MKLRYVVLLFIFCLPAILVLFQPGFFQSDDGEWMIIRFSAFYQALADGQLPVRWLGRLNHEYGYPVANFLYPGFMYLGVPIHLAGFGLVDTIKIILGLSMVGSAAFTFLWLRYRFDTFASFTGALVYLYTPYHLFDLYKRGSVGEVLALVVVPFILWQIERKSFVLASIGIAILILSHNTLALLFLPIIVGYMAIRKVSSIKYQVLSIVLGLVLSAFFWIPALLDLQYTKFSQTQVSNFYDHFASLQLIGMATFVVLFVALFRAIHGTLFLFVGFLGVFLSLSISSPVWEFLPVAFVQFPFRFLSLLLPSVAFLSAQIIFSLIGRTKLFAGVVLLLLLAISSMPYVRPSAFSHKGDAYYATNEDTTNVQNEYMPKWVNVFPVERASEKVQVLRGGNVENIIVKNNRVSFDVVSEQETLVRVNTTYFPGWEVFIDGQKSAVSYDNAYAVMDVEVARGKHAVFFRFGETPVRATSDIISLAGVFVLTGLWLRKRKIS